MTASWPTAFGDAGWMWAKVLANVGEVVLLPLIVVLSFLPQPELCGAMGQDGVLPKIFALQDAKGTFVWGSNISGVLMILFATLMPFNIIWNLVSLGVIISFNMTCSCLIMLRYGNGGTVDQPEIGYYVMAFWVFAATAAYPLWKGILEPALDGKPWLPAALALFAVGFAGAVATLVTIWRRGQQVHEHDAVGFRTPFVPFVPGLAIGLNFMLMATFSWWDHLACGVFLVVGLLFYLVSRVASAKSLGLYSEARQAKVVDTRV